MTDVLLRNALLPNGVVADVQLSGGRVTAVDAVSAPGTGATGTSASASESVDLTGHLLIGAFADAHLHPDKAFTAVSVVGDGTLDGAMTGYRAMLDAPEAQVRRRVRLALGLAIRSGVTAVRAHIGCGRLAGTRFIEMVAGIRAELDELIELQVVAHLGGPAPGTPWTEHLAILHAALDAGADLVGGNPSLEERPEQALDALLQVATDRSVDVDLHLDETTDPRVLLLRRLAAVAPEGITITASHCVSLGSLPAAESADVIDAVAGKNISVVTLPATNLYLQGRTSHPAVRGLPPVQALLDAGVLVAAGSDNLQDPFCPSGSADPLETARLLVLAARLEPAAARKLIGSAARQVLGLPAAGPEVGAAADLVALRVIPGCDPFEAHAGRKVWRSGRLISDTTAADPLPDLPVTELLWGAR